MAWREEILPLSLVRAHTKTDDIMSVTDEQLTLLRDAALSAAEAYTGLRLGPAEQVREPVRPPPSRAMPLYTEQPSTYFLHRTGHTVAGQEVFYYGAGVGRPIRVPATVGARAVRLPMLPAPLTLGCTDNGAEGHLIYRAGFSSPEDVPAAIRLGALKYIAHSIENAGDHVIVYGSSGRDTPANQVSASDPSSASGAISIWRSIMEDAV